MTFDVPKLDQVESRIGELLRELQLLKLVVRFVMPDRFRRGMGDSSAVHGWRPAHSMLPAIDYPHVD
jgi:hypothetical protein